MNADLSADNRRIHKISTHQRIIPDNLRELFFQK